MALVQHLLVRVSAGKMELLSHSSPRSCFIQRDTTVFEIKLCYSWWKLGVKYDTLVLISFTSRLMKLCNKESGL